MAGLVPQPLTFAHLGPYLLNVCVYGEVAEPGI